MSELQALQQEPKANQEMPWSPDPYDRITSVRYRRRTRSLLVTLGVLVLACVLGRASWDAYMVSPWTRDATVRAYVVTLAPEVAGRVTELHTADNRFVRKGDLLMVVDPTDYRIALRLASAGVQQAEANYENAHEQAERRRKLSDLSVTVEDRQSHEANALAADAQRQHALAQREQAEINLERTEVRSPVNGWVTNLLTRQGDYVTIGRKVISVVDADSFWVDAYFEESQLAAMHEGDPAQIKLMGYKQIVRGELGSIARAITVSNAQPDGQGLATVNPIFTWVRLAQRVPVRIRIDNVPDGVRLVAGMTATVQIGSAIGSMTQRSRTCCWAIRSLLSLGG
jgi:RND family efflux transporter MFP subunit